MNAKLIVPTIVMSGTLFATTSESFAQQRMAMVDGVPTVVTQATSAQMAAGQAAGDAFMAGLGGGGATAGGSSLPGLLGTGSETLGTVGNFAQGFSGGSAAAGGGAAAGGAAGVGAMVQDIGNILLQVMQISQLTQQTGLLGQQQQTLDEIKQINADDLATTRGIYGNIGSTADYNAGNSGLLSSISSGVDNILGILPSSGSGAGGIGTGIGTGAGAAAGTGANGNGLAGALSPLAKIGDFISGKADSLYDIFSGANRVAGVAQGFQGDPVGTSVEIIKMLFGEDRSDRLNSMSEEELNGYGFSTVAAALSSELDSEILKASENAGSRYEARMDRIGKIQQMLSGAKDQSSVLVLQAQLQKEMAGIQADNLAAQETANAAAAARAVNEAAYMKMRTLENQAMIRQNQ